MSVKDRLRFVAVRAVHALSDRLAPGQLGRDERDNLHAKLLISFALAADSNCVDVGANIGVVLRECLRVAPEGRHFAFEPQPDLAARLRREYPGVDVHELALSDQAADSVSFTLVPEYLELSGFRERSYPTGTQTREITVAADTLDNVLPEGYAPDFLKVDVEGAELQVFRGAARTLKAHRPTILFEHGVGAADRYGTTSGELFDFLAQFGYRIFDIEGDGPYTRTGFEDMFERPLWMFVAHP